MNFIFGRRALSKVIYLTAFILTAALPVLASPISITTLFSTGTGTEQSADPHYSILQDPYGNAGIAFKTDSSGFPFGPWFSNDSSSAWISPQASYVGNQGDAVGGFTYRTTFDLSGYNSSSASIVLKIAADNAITSVILNGVATPFSYSSFSQFSNPLTISSGFVAGVNTLDFVTSNSGGPGGIRVMASGVANAFSATPEPGTVLLFGSALSVLGLARRRKF